VETECREEPAPRLGKRVVACRGRDRGVEGRVEHGDMWGGGPLPARPVDGLELRELMQRVQFDDVVELVPDRVVDDHRIGTVASMHQAVSDTRGHCVQATCRVLEGVEPRRGPVVGDERDLDRR